MKVVKVSSSSFKLQITEPGGPIPVTRVSDVVKGGKLYKAKFDKLTSPPRAHVYYCANRNGIQG